MFNLSKINTVIKNLNDSQIDLRTITGELGKKQKCWKVRIKEETRNKMKSTRNKKDISIRQVRKKVKLSYDKRQILCTLKGIKEESNFKKMTIERIKELERLKTEIKET